MKMKNQKLYIKYLENYINKEIIGIEKIQLILYSKSTSQQFLQHWK